MRSSWTTWVPPGTGAGGLTNNYKRQEDRKFARDNMDGKVNWNRTSANQIWGKVSYMNAVVDDLTNYLGPDPNASGDGGFTKVYQATGPEQAFRPLDTIVVFSHDNQIKFMASAGGGVKVRVGHNALVRFDFRDYVTGIPKNFVTFPGVKFAGHFHNLVATGGLGITF